MQFSNKFKPVKTDISNIENKLHMSSKPNMQINSYSPINNHFPGKI